MLTKVKRIRRKKYQTGGETRKFENIPGASQPQQKDGIGTRNQFVDKFVTEQVKSPEMLFFSFLEFRDDIDFSLMDFLTSNSFLPALNPS